MPLRMSERTTPRQKTQITIATKTPTIAKSFLVTGRWAKMFPRTLMGDPEPGDESCNSSITLHWTLLKIWWCLRNYPGVPLVITPGSLSLGIRLLPKVETAPRIAEHLYPNRCNFICNCDTRVASCRAAFHQLLQNRHFTCWPKRIRDSEAVQKRTYGTWSDTVSRSWR